MTNQEAREILQQIRKQKCVTECDYSCKLYESETFCLEEKALDMAIKALEQQPCEDCISREAVKDMLTEEWTKYMPMELDMSLSFVLEKISELSSVTPKTESEGE